MTQHMAPMLGGAFLRVEKSCNEVLDGELEMRKKLKYDSTLGSQGNTLPKCYLTLLNQWRTQQWQSRSMKQQGSGMKNWLMESLHVRKLPWSRKDRWERLLQRMYWYGPTLMMEGIRASQDVDSWRKKSSCILPSNTHSWIQSFERDCGLFRCLP